MTQRGKFVAMTLHLDLYVDGTDTKDVQLGQINQLLANLDDAGVLWVLGGDFNLLPFDDATFQHLPVEHQRSYNPQSEIKLLHDKHQAIPSIEEVTGDDFAQWFTRFPMTQPSFLKFGIQKRGTLECMPLFFFTYDKGFTNGQSPHLLSHCYWMHWWLQTPS